jgi:prevent-host-death family protein
LGPKSNRSNHPSNVWSTQDAKAQFSELIRKTLESGDQIITRHGEEVAVIIPKKRYDQMTKKKKTLLDILRECPYDDTNSQELDFSRDDDFGREIDL